MVWILQHTVLVYSTQRRLVCCHPSLAPHSATTPGLPLAWNGQAPSASTRGCRRPGISSSPRLTLIMVLCRQTLLYSLCLHPTVQKGPPAGGLAHLPVLLLDPKVTTGYVPQTVVIPIGSRTPTCQEQLCVKRIIFHPLHSHHRSSALSWSHSRIVSSLPTRSLCWE